MENQEQKSNSDQPVVIGSWVAVTERLPEITDKHKYGGHKVIASWGKENNNMAQMEYCKRTVSGKDVFRFEWNGRIDPFGVKYWMEFPEPPNYL